MQIKPDYDPQADGAETWEEFLDWRPGFPAMMSKWFRSLASLAANTYPKEDDLVGELILAFMSASLSDLNDLMILTYRNSHHGGQKILRTLFERIVALEYISEHPEDAKRFMDYDAIDWEQVLMGIHAITGINLEEPARTNLAKAAQKARQEYKQEKCPSCKKPKYLGWTSLNSKDMAVRADLDHMHLHAFLIPSKLIHPTFWGMRDAVSKSSPMVNTLCCTHELIVQMVLIHRRHFAARAITPLMNAAVRDFLSIWTYSETSFGGVLTRGQTRDGGRQIFY